MSLEKFFAPKSVAIVGASTHKTKVGFEILDNLIQAGFPGTIYPVNNKADSIQGLKCYPDLPSIGDAPDLVVIVVPAKVVPEIMLQCGKVGVKAVIINTALLARSPLRNAGRQERPLLARSDRDRPPPRERCL